MPDGLQVGDAVSLSMPVALGGLDASIDPTEPGPYSPYMKNMIVEKDRVRKRMGYSQLGSNLPLSGIGAASISYTDARGTNHIIELTTTHAYEYNTSNDTWSVITPNDELEACESGWTQGSGDTVAYDATDFIKGSKSLKVTLAAGRSDGDLLAYKDISSVDASARTEISFWIKSSTDLAAGALEIVVSESNHASGEKTGTYVECLSTVLTADKWTHVSLTKTLSSYNAVISVSLFANAALASGLIVRVDDITACTCFTGGVDNIWAWCLATDTTAFANNGGTALVISNNVDDLHYFEGHSGNKFAVLVHGYTNFANCKDLAEFWNHLFILNYNNGANNIRSLAFAVAGNLDDWSSAGSGGTTLTDSTGKILRAAKLGYELILYSDETITIGKYYGQPTVFAFPTVVYQIGLAGQRALHILNNMHYFLSSDQQVYRYTGGTNLVPIGDRVDNLLFSQLDATKWARVVTGRDIGGHKLYFAIPRAGEDYPRALYAYSYRMQRLPWEFHEFADDVRGMAELSNQYTWYCDDTRWTDEYCDEVNFYCDASAGQSGYPLACFITSDGYVMQIDDSDGQDDDADIECEYQTPDFTIDREEHKGRWGWVSIVAKADIANSTVALYYSTDSGTTWTELTNSPISLTSTWTTYRLPVDVLARRIRYRPYQNSDGDFQIRGSVKTRAILQPARD